MRRLDGSLAERTTYAPPVTNPDVSGTEFAVFAQDRWRVNDRLVFELGFRSDRDDIVEKVNFSPRAGMSVSLLPDGRGILRGGFGKFAERTPLTVGAFTQYEAPTVTRYAASGEPIGAPITFVHTLGDVLKTPESIVQTVAWDQRIERRFFFKAAYLHRDGSHAYIVNPDVSDGLLTLSSSGASSTGKSRPRADSWPASTGISRFPTSDRTAPATSTTTTSSMGIFVIPSSDQTRIRSARPMFRIGSSFAAMSACPGSGCLCRSTSGARDFRGRRWMNSRISLATGTVLAGCREYQRSISRWRAR